MKLNNFQFGWTGGPTNLSLATKGGIVAKAENEKMSALVLKKKLKAERRKLYK